jgi:integrase/recombinase XerC
VTPDLPVRAGPENPPAPAVDPVQLLLADKRSLATRRAYAGDLKHFFGGDPEPARVREFALGSPPEIALRLAQFKAAMIEGGAAEATINRRLAAVRSLLKFCHRLGFARTDGRNLVDNEPAQCYRDTRGVAAKQMRRLLRLPDTRKLSGIRDLAILKVLAENAFRRGEVWQLDVVDFLPAERRLMILGKGRGTQKEPVTITSETVRAVQAYLAAAGHTEGPLFRNVSRRPDHRGDRLTPDGLYKMVRGYGAKIGEPQLSPHRIRHSAITTALDETGGDVRKVQRFSRHKKLETLQIYDDNRTDFAGEVTGLVGAAYGRR